jgi:hypothetical protein
VCRVCCNVLKCIGDYTFLLFDNNGAGTALLIMAGFHSSTFISVLNINNEVGELSSHLGKDYALHTACDYSWENQ